LLHPFGQADQAPFAVVGQAQHLDPEAVGADRPDDRRRGRGFGADVQDIAFRHARHLEGCGQRIGQHRAGSRNGEQEKTEGQGHKTHLHCRFCQLAEAYLRV
jgi:hypothetical protein